MLLLLPLEVRLVPEDRVRHIVPLILEILQDHADHILRPDREGVNTKVSGPRQKGTCA